MTDPGKRKLSAKEILKDIRSGMDSSGLKHKYGLSDKSLQSVYRQLLAAGALTEHEVQRLGPGDRSSESSHEVPKAPQWQCPACSAPLAAEVPECPVCGVVVAKFVARQEQAEHDSVVAFRFAGDSDLGGGKGWMPVIASIVVLALVGGALLVWSTHRSNENPRIAAVGAQPESLQEVRSEADQARETNGEPETTSIDDPEVTPEEPGGTMVPPDPIVAVPQEPFSRPVEPPRETGSTPPKTAEYLTGVLRQFASGDFKREVVEASKTYPVLFQFYSET